MTEDVTQIGNNVTQNFNNVIESVKEEQRTVNAALNEEGALDSSVKSGGATNLFQNEELGKDQFLNLLITSLRYQDPLNPASNEQFISQMAEFSALENSQNMNTNLVKLNSTMEGMAAEQKATMENFIEEQKKSLEALVSEQKNSAQVMSDASVASMLGQVGRFKSKEIEYDGKVGVPFGVHVEDPQGATVQILDKNGAVVRSEVIEDTGDHLMEWDGARNDKLPMPEGKYEFKIVDSTGKEGGGYIFQDKRIEGISYGKDGVQLDTGSEKHNMEDVLEIFEPQQYVQNLLGPGAGYVPNDGKGISGSSK